MGAVYKASCACGFTSQVTDGGSRATFLETNMRPHYCERCGIVECNVAPQRPNFDLPICCPKCKSENVIAYGTNLLNKNKEKKFQLPEISFYRSENLCPACKNYSLEFKTITRFG